MPEMSSWPLVLMTANFAEELPQGVGQPQGRGRGRRAGDAARQQPPGGATHGARRKAKPGVEGNVIVPEPVEFVEPFELVGEELS